MASSSPSGRSAYPENYMLQLIDELKTTIKTIRKDQLLMISIEMIKVFTDSSRRMDSTHLPELISLFDGDNYENCFRLDVASLHCVIHILLRASPCMARERGFYLLLESMTELTALTQNPIDPGIMVSARQRKSILGRKSCRSLFGTFIKDHPMVARRWSGQYILELLKHSTDNTKFVLSFGRHLRNLGAMVLMSEISYDLRLISAMIIQQLMLADPDPSSFWPQDTDHIFFSWLIRGAAIDAAWMKSFIKLLSMIDKTNVASNPQATSHLFGAAKIKPVALLETSDLSISSDDHPLTIATDLETISFFILSQGRLQIVDIPRNFIEDISVEVADSCLHIDMVEGTHYVTSGLPVTTDVVYVTFEKSRTALGILDALDGVVVPHASQEMSQEPSGSSVGGNANTQNQAKATKDQQPPVQMNDVLPTLPLSPKAPEVNPAPRKRAINREKRQVTKTLASARQKRSAASKAAEKLAHATKMENLPYDLDDPIESSAPERPRIAPDTDAMEIDRMGINDNPEKSHNQPPTSRQQEGELKLPADSNSSKDITLELASSLPEVHMQPMPFSEESTRPHNEVQVQPTWPENPNDGRDNCRTSSTPSRKRKSVASDGSLMSHEDSIEADMPANKRLKEDYSNGQASGNKLATAIKTAGVEVDHKPNDNVTIQGNNNSCEAESIKKRPQINKTLESSQISRNVSLFIAKQNAKGQNTDTTGDIQNIQNDAEDQDCNRASPMQPQTLETEAHRELKHARNTNNRLSKVQMQNQSQVSDADIEIATSAPNADSIDGSSGQRSGSLNASAHGDYTASAVHSVIMISSDCEELQGNMIVNSTSINDLSEDTVTVGHTMKGPLDSQIKTVDENGSPRPRQISRRSRVNGVQLGCAQQDQEKHKEKPGAPSPGIRGNAAGKVTNDVESERLEGGFEEDSTGIASHNISNDSSSSLNPPESTLNKRHAISGVPETTNRNPKLNTRAKGKPKEPSTVIKKLKGVVNTSRNVNKVRRSTRISKAPSSRGRNNNRHIPRASSDGVDASERRFLRGCVLKLDHDSSEGISGDATQEWQKALRATQKATLDILLDTSNRLVRHLMNEEAAILNVVDVYKKGGDRILDQLEEMHKKSLNTFLGKLRPVKKGLNDLRQGILRQLEENELVLGDIATKKFSRRCEKNKQALQRKIENTAKKV
ncbi:hypothetical protein CISG_06441 [Coccidioides immitis RMSCC 3703]|uniref:Uncharacterized protein n=1 Tax=Coccidioides immitis RMSCC 3703 TaxID=454286 RepID=A0A0J8R3L4_COCIT|nr:hypothetical protein CISG_06441 [Coccidioides immitis RMSCC 3703]